VLVEEFVETYPRVFHMAEAGTWPQIQRHGLLSTTALLDLFEVEGSERLAIESTRRPEMVRIEHPAHGAARIRDNKPLRERELLRCLDGMSPQQWFELLNGKVFFWLSERRLESLLGARAYRDRPHDVLTIDTASLIARHGGTARLASINTGATLYPNAPIRGAHTFMPIDQFDYEQARQRRGRRDAVAELTIEYAVPDIEAVAVAVERRSSPPRHPPAG
jgi:hypothetical protein